MVSQEVLTALESLHRELEKLEPAIKHVETAQQVTQTLKVIPQKHIDLIKEVQENDARHKSELHSLFSKEVKHISQETKKLASTTEEIQQRTIVEQQELTKLLMSIKNFHERIEKINFPERLDKLDANVAGTVAAIQSVLSRLDNVERNITDRLKDISERQKEATKEIIKKHNIHSFITWALIVILGIIIFTTKHF